jgi:hypothetical protein
MTHRNLTWFGLISIHSQAETIKRKFNIKRWNTKSSKEKTTKNPKPQYTQFLLSHKREKTNKRENSIFFLMPVWHHNIVRRSETLFLAVYSRCATLLL